MNDEIKDHFITHIIDSDLEAGHVKEVVTRFPPEPNGYLHIGHAKSIWLNFTMKRKYQGTCHLRFDDTNPLKEEQEFIDNIKADVKWLGFEWDGEEKYASDYFETFYQAALILIKSGLAYVDSQSAEEMRANRGTLQSPGVDSPYRNRTVEENLTLFEAMRDGQCSEGEHVLRAKIDMAHANMNLRDPALYRIRFATHPKTGDKWCIYPMYDFAHSLSDAIEGITHSICTLEFQDHRPLYDWCVEQTNMANQPHQYEFARLNISHTITSKRKLKQLVDENIVDSWDDPRMPTLSGMRQRGFPASAIRQFCELTGVSKSDSVIDMSVFEECVRDELNDTAPRAMCVLDPIKITLVNYDEGKVETLTPKVHPNDESLGTRNVPFSRELYIDRNDFMLEPEKGYFRLSPGKEVRLRNAYVIKCIDVTYDNNGEIDTLLCEYDPNTLGKKPEGRKVKGVIHWLSVNEAKPCDITLYDRLFSVEEPQSVDNFIDCINPNSKQVITNAFVEPSVQQAEPGVVFQFERLGYFCTNKNETTLGAHRVVNLKDTWKKK